MNNIKILMFLCLLVIIWACSEQKTTYYPKYDDAVKDGAIQRGWIPSFIPNTSIDIYEQHDLDSNELWICFVTSDSNRNLIVSDLKKLTYDEIIGINLRKPSNVSWWFGGLIEQSPTNDNALYAEIYKVNCKSGYFGYIALDRVSDKVYYWCTR